MPSSVYTEVLHRAAEMLGGKAALRAWLRVSARDVEAWLEGVERPPVYVFLKAVDLINGGQYKPQPEAAQLAARSKRLRAALLESAPGHAARRRTLSVEEFLNAEFAPSDARLIADNALNALVNGTPATRANLQLVCTEGLRIVAHLGFQQPFLDFFATVGHDLPSTCGRAAEALQQVVVRDVVSDEIFKGTEAGEVMLRAEARACVSTPLVDDSGTLIGVASAHYEAPHHPSSDELEAIELVCKRASYWLGAAQP